MECGTREMTPSENAIELAMRTLGLDRMQAVRHLQSHRLAIEVASRNRAALTAKRDADGEGCLDSPPAPSALIAESRLTRQSYGIACAQTTFGGPRGIWLECKGCSRSDVIVGSRFAGDRYADISDAEAAEIFRFHGWTGDGERMTNQRCPKCSSS